MAGIAKTIISNTFSQVLARVVSTAVSVIMLASLARYLGLAGFGDYSTAMAFVAFIAILADMGLYTVAVREIAQKKKDEREIVANVLSLRIILALAFLIITPIIGYLIPSYSHEVKLGIVYVAIATFFILIDQIFVGIFQAHLKMQKRAIIEVVARSLLLGFVLYAISISAPLHVFFIALIASNVVQATLSYLYSRRIIGISLGFDITYWREILKESLPLGIVIALGMVYFKIDSVMLSIMTNNEVVGIYSAPYKILEVLIIFPAIFMNSVFPVISRYIHEGSEKYSTSFQKSFDFMSIFAFPMLVGVFLTAPHIIGLILGQEFAVSTVVLQILIFAVFIIFFGTIFGNFIVAAGDQKKLVPVYVFSVCLNVLLNWILIPHYTYIGAAVATVCTELLVCSLAFLYLYRLKKMTVSLRRFMLCALASGIMGCIVYLMLSWSIFVIIPLAMIIYAAVLLLLKVIDIRTIKILLARGQ